MNQLFTHENGAGRIAARLHIHHRLTAIDGDRFHAAAVVLIVVRVVTAKRTVAHSDHDFFSMNAMNAFVHDSQSHASPFIDALQRCRHMFLIRQLIKPIPQLADIDNPAFSRDRFLVNAGELQQEVGGVRFVFLD